jgi:hypothetical protein
MASDSDLAVLRASLRENGQQDPLDVTPDGLILDGRTRWTLLTELGAQTVQVREVVVPDGEQTHYIVDRALARRHLTNDQKRALNELLRSTVIAVVEDPKTREEMRIGMSSTQRAAKLGVTPVTVKVWDDKDRQSVRNHTDPQTSPTHILRGGGNPTPYPVAPAKRNAPKVRGTPKPKPLRTDRPVPAWSRHFSMFCRRSRPEDHEFLLRMAREIHAALRQNGIEYQED